MSDELISIGRFGQYEVWEHAWETGPEWSITNAQGDMIDPGDNDLFHALALVRDRKGDPDRR